MTPYERQEQIRSASVAGVIVEESGNVILRDGPVFIHGLFLEGAAW